MTAFTVSSRAQLWQMYDSAKSRSLPTRLYKGQDIGEILAILITRDQLGVEFAKRLARSISPPLDRVQVLNWFAKALGYHTWIHALQHRSDNGKVILSLRHTPVGLKNLQIVWHRASETLMVDGDVGEGAETHHYHTNY